MDVATMITDLGDHGFMDTSADTKLRMIQDAIWEIEGLRPWPFLDATATLSFDGTSASPTTPPANFKAALKVKDLATGQNLEPTTLQDLEEAVGTQLTQVAAPRVYYVEAEQLKLWPVPPAGTSLRLRYIRQSAAVTASTLSAEILLPARHHRLIVLGALVRLYDMEDDVELSQRFQQHFETRLERMVEDLFRKQYDRPEYIRVNDPDAWDY